MSAEMLPEPKEPSFRIEDGEFIFGRSHLDSDKMHLATRYSTLVSRHTMEEVLEEAKRTYLDTLNDPVDDPEAQQTILDTLGQDIDFIHFVLLQYESVE